MKLKTSTTANHGDKQRQRVYATPTTVNRQSRERVNDEKKKQKKTGERDDEVARGKMKRKDGVCTME